MTDTNTRRQQLMALKLILIIGGVIMIVFALLADRFGFGRPGGIGVGQFLLFLIGVLVLLLGVLGKRFGDFYKGVAIILLNTLIFLAILELGAIVVSRSIKRVEKTEIQQLPYYADQDWTDTYWQEAYYSETYQYKPYVIWSHLPFEGDTVNLNQYGHRETPGADCSEGAYLVFTFGGSTMMGWGSPDWGTIAAYLQKGLDKLVDGPVCVVNLAEDGYVSTQSLIALLLELQGGNHPDVVIFYDGVNEVLAAYESGHPSSHVTLAKISSRFEEQEHPLLKWVKASRLYSLVESWLFKALRNNLDGRRIANSSNLELLDNDELADSVSDVYFKNYDLTRALAQEYGFDYFFFWQPQLSIGDKNLTRDEQEMLSRISPGWQKLARAIYQNVESGGRDYDRLVYMAEVFDDQEKQIWIDEAGHVTPEGNRLIAEEMLSVIWNELVED
jgi:hypothetical protein